MTGDAESSLHILVIMGSPRQGNTYRAAERIREIMQSYGPVEFEYLWLRDLNLAPCRGCFTCFAKGEASCPNRDNVQEIEQKMRNADGVIFASPVYGMNVTGLMKTFIDRLSYVFHRPRFFDKKTLLLTTSGSLGTREVLTYLYLVAQVWGFEIAGQAGLITPPGTIPQYRNQENERILRRAAGSFSASLRSGRRRSLGLKDIAIFRGQRGSFGELKEAAPVDYQYWKEHGWLDPGVRYFVDVPVNPVYDLIGRFVEYMARRQVRRDVSGSG